MSLEENKAVVRRYFEEVRSQGRLEVVDELFAPNAIRQTINGPLQAVPERQKRVVTQWRLAFPDYKDTILTLIAEDDRVMAHIMFTGTHTGTFEYESLGPWAPTGRSIKCWEFFLYRLAGGKIIEVSAVWDRRDFMRQIGVADSPP